ncbi:MAG: hypothetical protein LBM99_01805 [Bacillales bacterium]|jgi:hypothetical protein|nr:hypothetical protein [Bacillales bacterium]
MTKEEKIVLKKAVLKRVRQVDILQFKAFKENTPYFYKSSTLIINGAEIVEYRYKVEGLKLTEIIYRFIFFFEEGFCLYYEKETSDNTAYYNPIFFDLHDPNHNISSTHIRMFFGMNIIFNLDKIDNEKLRPFIEEYKKAKKRHFNYDKEGKK